MNGKISTKLINDKYDNIFIYIDNKTGIFNLTN